MREDGKSEITHRLACSFLVAAALLIGWSALPAMAQALPHCGQETAGLVACIESKLCSCGFVRGGTMTGEPDGYRWDCGVMRPLCPPASSPLPYQGPMPDIVEIDRSNRSSDQWDTDDDSDHADHVTHGGHRPYPPRPMPDRLRE